MKRRRRRDLVGMVMLADQTTESGGGSSHRRRNRGHKAAGRTRTKWMRLEERKTQGLHKLANGGEIFPLPVPPPLLQSPLGPKSRILSRLLRGCCRRRSELRRDRLLWNRPSFLPRLPRTRRPCSSVSQRQPWLWPPAEPSCYASISCDDFETRF